MLASVVCFFDLTVGDFENAPTFECAKATESHCLIADAKGYGGVDWDLGRDDVALLEGEDFVESKLGLRQQGAQFDRLLHQIWGISWSSRRRKRWGDGIERG